jgi:hypothetical protein
MVTKMTRRKRTRMRAAATRRRIRRRNMLPYPLIILI